MKIPFVIILALFSYSTMSQITITPGDTTILIPAGSLDTFNMCPPIGQTDETRLQDLNKLKNRYDIPSDSDINSNVSVATMLVPGDDNKRWSTSNAAQITGYVMEVKPGGSESCNCHLTDKAKIDTHIVLVASPDSTKGGQRIIIEITPRMRFLMLQKGIDWSTDAIKATFTGHWVKVTGWLFFDEEHTNASENTSPGGVHNWRATAWEIHPITSLELVK